VIYERIGAGPKCYYRTYVVVLPVVDSEVLTFLILDYDLLRMTYDSKFPYLTKDSRKSAEDSHSGSSHVFTGNPSLIVL
jgi:hypothetical protein